MGLAVSFAGPRRTFSRPPPVARDRSAIAGFPGSISAFRFGSPALTHSAPNLADRVGLPLHVGEEGGVGGALQPLPDQNPEDNLQAHRELERDRRPPRQDPGSIQEVPGKNEEDSGFFREQSSLPFRVDPLTRRSEGERSAPCAYKF